jgi:NAD(P)-dependent dehydrogenase (short-subunit alcohol dehydrogenase family)
VFVSKPFTGYTAEDYALLVGVNLTGFFWVTRRVIGEMASRYGGHVVNISATIAEVANSKAPSVLAALTKGGDRLPPLGRVGQVADVVDAILFLESSPYITGEILHVDGGQIAGH